MNVCAVRTIHGTLSEQLNPTLENMLWLPHEPKSEHRFGLQLIKLDKTIMAGVVGHTWIGTYAECKHCGGVFAVEGE